MNKKLPLHIYLTQIWPSDHEIIAIWNKWLDIARYQENRHGFWLANCEFGNGNITCDTQFVVWGAFHVLFSSVGHLKAWRGNKLIAESLMVNPMYFFVISGTGCWFPWPSDAVWNQLWCSGTSIPWGGSPKRKCTPCSSNHTQWLDCRRFWSIIKHGRCIKRNPWKEEFKGTAGKLFNISYQQLCN